MYLFPGLSSLVIQILIGVLIAVPLIAGIFRSEIKAFFSRSRLGGRKKR